MNPPTADSSKSAASQPRIIAYSADRSREVTDLLNTCLGQKPHIVRDERYWTWKHEQNPFGPSILVLAESAGRIVGLRALLRWRFVEGPQTLEVAKSVDSVTHPDFRRRGIFSRLTTESIEVARLNGIQLLFNTPNRQSLPGYMKLGWRHVSALPLYVKILRPFAAVRHAIATTRTKSHDPDFAGAFKVQPVPAHTVLDDEASVADLLQAREPGQHGLETDRTIQFLRWRYTQHPHIRYFAEVSITNGRLDGVLLYRAGIRLGMREILLDDVIVRDGRRSVISDLMEQLLVRAGADYIMTQGAGFEREFRALGFHRAIGKTIRLIARPVAGDEAPNSVGAQDMISRRWSLCFGDLEGL